MRQESPYVVNVSGTQVGRFTFQPGWKWSDCVKPVAGTESCQVEHLGYVVSGRIHIAHEDGTAVDLGPGDAYRIEPGHDAWVLGDDPFVGVEFSSADRFAKAC
jgi:EutQ-like cupin domain